MMSSDLSGWDEEAVVETGLWAVWVAEWHEHVHMDKDLRCLFGLQRPGGYIHIGVTNSTFAVKLWHGSRGGAEI